ncbi:MAG: O-antigen ligase family protein [Candidatus Hydrogenedentes bacterium]|nr:O-antigen ligase family protein [Candidatus Hydrogenedentota bacterium]
MQNRHRLPSILRAGIAIYAAALILSVYPYSPLPAVDIKIFVTHVAAFVLAALCAAAEWRGEFPGARPRLLMGALAAFTAVNLAASLASPYPMNALAMTARFFSLSVLCYVTARTFTTARHAASLLVAVVIAAAIASAYGFVQRAGFDPLPWDTSLAASEQFRQLPSTFGNPNLAGHVLTLAIVCALFVASRRGDRWAIVLVPLFLAHLALTRHRASWLGLGACAVFALVAWRARSRCNNDAGRGIGVAVAAFTIAATAIAAIGVGALAARSGRGVPMDTSLLLRYNSFYGAARMIADRPLLGVGPDNYRILNVDYWTPYEQEHFARDRMLNEHPHNEFLMAAISAGIPGLLAYVFLLARAFVAALTLYFAARDESARQFGLACAVLLLVFAIDGALGFNLYAPVSGGILFLVLGLLDGVYSAHAANGKTAPRGLPWATTACAVIAFACAALGTATFASQLHLARGHSAMYWKAFPTAIEQYDRAASYAPSDWMPLYRAAKARAALGDLPGALGDLSASIARNPRYIPSLLDAAYIELGLANNEPLTASPDVLNAARAYAAEAQRLCPHVPEAQEILGRAALTEAERLRARATGLSAERERLLREAADRFTRAIAYGAPNVAELAAYQAQAEALLGAPLGPSG